MITFTTTISTSLLPARRAWLTRNLLGLLAAASSLSAATCAGMGIVGSPAAQVLQYTPYEVAIAPDKPGANPYVNGPEIKAEFTAPSGKKRVVWAFWDGPVFRVRFAPNEAGTWNMALVSPDSCVNGLSTSVYVRAPLPSETAANPLLCGFLKSDSGVMLRSDGTPLQGFGDSQFGAAEMFTNAEFNTWMRSLAANHATTVLFSGFLGLYDSATTSPFVKSDATEDKLSLAYFANLDAKVASAMAAGIHVRLMPGGFPGNVRPGHDYWFKQFVGQDGTAAAKARVDRWFSYLVSRYAGFNVSWLLFGETDERLAPWFKDLKSEVEHYATIVDTYDPYDRPIGVHLSSYNADTKKNYAIVAAVSRIDYISLQLDSSASRTETQYQDVEAVSALGKPVLVDEYAYEAFEEYDDLATSASRGVRNTYRNALRRCFSTIGSIMRNNPGSHFAPQAAADSHATLANYLLNDRLMVRLRNFSVLFAGLDLLLYKKDTAVSSRNVAARFGTDTVVFADDGSGNRRLALNLAGQTRTLQAIVLEVQTGACRILANVTGGRTVTLDLGTTGDAALVLRPATAKAPLSCAGFMPTI